MRNLHEALNSESSENNDWVEENGVMVPSDEFMDVLFRNAVETAILKSKLAGLPIAKWDNVLEKAYRLYPDGRREYDD